MFSSPPPLLLLLLLVLLLLLIHLLLSSSPSPPPPPPLLLLLFRLLFVNKVVVQAPAGTALKADDVKRSSPSVTPTAGLSPSTPRRRANSDGARTPSPHHDIAADSGANYILVKRKMDRDAKAALANLR